MHQLPETGYLRLPQIIGHANASPPIPPIIPVSKSTWWQGIRSGRFPKPVKLGPRITAWRVEDIRALLDELANPPGLSDIEHSADGVLAGVGNARGRPA
jgi:prophage regulatory protein